MKKIKLPSLKLPKVYVYGIDVIKNFLFFVLFLFITFFSIVLIIAPAVKKFKQHQKEYYETKHKYEIVLNNYKEATKELKELEKKNKKIILALKRDFNPQNFKNFAKSYMSVKNIKEINSTTYKKDFIKTTYIVDTVIKSPKNFYDFIDALKNYKNVLRVYFPINFQKEKENISLTLKIEHFKLKKSKSKKPN